MSRPKNIESNTSAWMMLQYRVIYWGIRLAIPLTIAIAFFVSAAYPPDRNLIEGGIALLLVLYFLALQLFLLPKVTNAKRIDVFAAVFLTPPVLASSMTPYFDRGNETIGVAVGMIVFGSMCFVSDIAFIAWTGLAAVFYIINSILAGNTLSYPDWINLLLVAPGLAFIVRIVIQKNYTYLLERMEYEDELTSELESAATELESTRRIQEQSQHDLETQSLQLTTVLSRAPIILSVTDSNGKLLQSRGHGLEKLGLQENELVGKDINELYRDYPDVIAAFEEAKAGKRSNVRVSFASGLTHEIQYCPVIDPAGQFAGVVGVGVDVSECAQADLNRIALESQLFQAQKMESLGVLASGVAHDFNNYLSAIIAFCEVLGNHNSPDVDANGNATKVEVQDIVDEIQRIAQNAAGVCEQMLMFAGKSTHEKTYVDLCALVRDNEKFFRAIISKRINLAIDLPEGGVPVLANKLLLQQAIVNLIKNSSEALICQSGGIVRISSQLVGSLPETDKNTFQIGELEPAEDATTYAMLTVKDNGPGISEPELHRIFEPYFSSKDSGHGFGLAITAGIVRHHGGVIYCQTGDTGTRIDLVFPSNPLAIPKPKPVSTLHSENDNGWKILLVDDEPAIIKSIKLAFDQLGYDVTTAQSGHEVLGILEKQGGQFDCIVLDYSMPEMNGLELLQTIRGDGIKTPVILCSGFFDLPGYDEITPDATLRKPYSIRRLQQAIRELCTGDATINP